MNKAFAALSCTAAVLVLAVWILAKLLVKKWRDAEMFKRDFEALERRVALESSAMKEVLDEIQKKKESYQHGDILDRFNASLERLRDN